MKNLKTLIIAFAILTMNVSAAVLTNPVRPTDKLRADIVKIIGNECPYDYDRNECTAEVLFTVNQDGEIIVLSVDSPNTRAEGFLKNKLNYKKVSSGSYTAGDTYLLPLRIIKEN